MGYYARIGPVLQRLIYQFSEFDEKINRTFKVKP
jgi:hypothetical protein